LHDIQNFYTSLWRGSSIKNERVRTFRHSQ
jgi:hypothetical protein